MILHLDLEIIVLAKNGNCRYQPLPLLSIVLALPQTRIGPGDDIEA